MFGRVGSTVDRAIREAPEKGNDWGNKLDELWLWNTQAQTLATDMVYRMAELSGKEHERKMMANMSGSYKYPWE